MSVVWIGDWRYSILHRSHCAEEGISRFLDNSCDTNHPPGSFRSLHVTIGVVRGGVVVVPDSIGRNTHHSLDIFLEDRHLNFIKFQRPIKNPR